MFRYVLCIYRWLFARSQFRKFNMLIFHMGLRGLGILNYENNRVNGEKYLTRKILPIILANEMPVFFDVGANVGRYSSSLLSIFPAATIYAFEPHPETFSILQTNSCSKIQCYNMAIGHTSGKLTLYDRIDKNGSPHASLYKDVILEIHKQKTNEHIVSIETLDEFCVENNIRDIDFLKIDTEGSELSVIRGAAKLIKNRSIKCIHFEFNDMNIVSGVFFRDFRNMLKDFDLYRLLPNGVMLLNDCPILTELFAYQNIIAVSKCINIKL